MAQELKNYKDRLFCFIFGSEEHRDWTLSLYNAVSGRNYTDPGEITITTMTEALYMGMHNDVAILIRDELDLWEHQASFNPNMPLRMPVYSQHLRETDYPPEKEQVRDEAD